MKLTNKQQEIAIKLREEIIQFPPEFSSLDYIDYTRALAVMIDSIFDMRSPPDMQDVFSEAWVKYTSFWTEQHHNLIEKTVKNPDLFEFIKAHPRGNEVVGQILDRIRETCGKIKPGLDVSKVKIDDILAKILD